MRRPRLLAFIIGIAASQALSGQAPPAQAPPAQAPPVLRSTTRLVQVNVVVRGRNGEPVLGLTKDDFDISDSGVPQEVATLAVESMLPEPSAASPDARPTATPPPNIFTNVGRTGAQAPKAVTVILLDGLNTAFADQVYARQQLIKFLYTLTPADRVALYALGRGVSVLHDFTDDPLALLKALERHKAHIGGELADSNPAEANTGDAELDAFLDAANQKIADFQNIDRVRLTLNGLQAIAEHLAVIPGRKNLVWISGGFPIDIGMDEMQPFSTAERRSFSVDIEQATRAITGAQLAIYPVDARGLATNPDMAASAPTPKNMGRPQQGPSRGMQNISKTQDAMKVLAERTGGKAYYNSNDLKGAIRGAIDDAKVTYILGYYPRHQTWDGKFHQIKVRVKRSGVDVRHRRGYFAFAEPPMTEQVRRAALTGAAWSPLAATQVGLSARVVPDLPKEGSLRMLMAVETRDVSFEQKDGRWTGVIDVLFWQQAAADRDPLVTSQTMTFNFTPAEYQDAMQRGLIFVKDFEAAAVAFRLKLVVRDASSGRIGSVDIRAVRREPSPRSSSSLFPARP